MRLQKIQYLEAENKKIRKELDKYIKCSGGVTKIFYGQHIETHTVGNKIEKSNLNAPVTTYERSASSEELANQRIEVNYFCGASIPSDIRLYRNVFLVLLCMLSCVVFCIVYHLTFILKRCSYRTDTMFFSPVYDKNMFKLKAPLLSDTK